MVVTQNRSQIIRFTSACLSVAVFLASCSTVQGSSQQSAASVNTAVTQTSEGLGDAVSSPLYDLNLSQQPIPPVLAALTSPYLPPAPLDCASLSASIMALNAVLGDDVDVVEERKRSSGERAGAFAADATLDAVEGTTSGLIPFRGLVRQASGAESHEKKRQRAYRFGETRRAYLKGVGEARGCAQPSSPVR